MENMKHIGRVGCLTRRVMRTECSWLEQDLAISQIVYEYLGHTYGRISDRGIAVTNDGETFYEVPNNSVEWFDITEAIAAAKSIADLKQVITTIGGVQGLSKFYTANELSQILDGVAEHKFSLNYVTRSYDLRDKVAELLAN
ncbi:MAG: hypothetical protein V1765_03510 [bacterium]